MNIEKSICIIDDDKVYTYMLKKMIQKLGNCQTVINYSNGLEALESIKKSIAENDTNVLPDIIFLDINMPVMNGWQFLEAYSEIQSKISKKIQIYQTSSSVNQADIDKSLGYHVVTKYIVKSMDINTLKSLVMYAN
jgi:CheY-like chemotaxis protein